MKNTTDDAPHLLPASGPVGELTLRIKEKMVLRAIYMSFIKQGGLFIPTTKAYELGDQINIKLTLLDDTERYDFTATVVWITPTGAQGNRAPGIGVQFQGEVGTKLNNKIITYLAGALIASEHPTHTL